MRQNLQLRKNLSDYRTRAPATCLSNFVMNNWLSRGSFEILKSSNRHCWRAYSISRETSRFEDSILLCYQECSNLFCVSMLTFVCRLSPIANGILLTLCKFIEAFSGSVSLPLISRTFLNYFWVVRVT